MENYQFASQYLAKIAATEGYEPESGYTGDWADDYHAGKYDDDPGAIDLLSGAATVGGGYFGGKYGARGGRKLADYIYRNGVDVNAKRLLKDWRAYGQHGLNTIGGKIADTGARASLRGYNLKNTADRFERMFGNGANAEAAKTAANRLRFRSKLTTGVGNKLWTGGEFLERYGLNSENLNKALEANKTKVNDVMRGRADALKNNKGLLPKKWSRAGKAAGGITGTLAASALAYALTNPRARKEFFG